MNTYDTIYLVYALNVEFVNWAKVIPLFDLTQLYLYVVRILRSFISFMQQLRLFHVYIN